MKNIAILGFGVVGSGTAEVLTQNKNIIEKKIGEEIRIKYILDLREFPDSPFGDLIVHDFDTILNDPEVVLVAEMMGGSHPAYEFSKSALLSGKSVVTSNKEVVASFGSELLQTARENGVAYLFEASVGGGIPIIRPMCNDLSSNNISEINGILNGTTNYILTKMTDEGACFDDVLKDAQNKGYAERNPAADIEGLDAARKIVILSALAFGKAISPDDIHVEGITSITTELVEASAKLGYAVKLIGHAEMIDGKILAMVSPRLVPLSEPLAGINGVFNGILLDADMVGKVMFYGPGAGKLPTASAVSADIVDILSHRPNEMKLPVFTPAAGEDIADIESYSCKRLFMFKADETSSLIEDITFGSILASVYHGEYVALITGEMSERMASDISEKLGDCMMCRLL